MSISFFDVLLQATKKTIIGMIKILVIEDEKRVADLLKIGLEENGY